MCCTTKSAKGHTGGHACLLAFFLAVVWWGSAQAAVLEVDPTGDLLGSIDSLQPGDELIVAGGVYSIGSRTSIGISGTAEAPILIRAKDGEVPVITRPDALQNVLNIEGSTYVVFRGLEITGGSHGIRLLDSDFITIEDCHIHHVNGPAITANIPGSFYRGLRMLRNHIHHTGDVGEGYYMGCNDHGCEMSDSLIEGNYIHDLNVGTSQGDGIEIKIGSYNNTVRDNVIHGTGYPCITVYGTAGRARNIIEGNVMWDCGDHGIQVAADAIVRNNIILSSVNDGIYSKEHQGATPSNLEIVNNTVLEVGGNAIQTRFPTGSVIVANNALYSQGGLAIRILGDSSLVTLSANIGVGGTEGITSGFDAIGVIGVDFVDAAFGASRKNVFPAPGSVLIGAADPTYTPAVDFNGTDRSGSNDVGAYVYDTGGNPGWPIGPSFKALPDNRDPDGEGELYDGGDLSDGGGEQAGDSDGSLVGSSCDCRTARPIAALLFIPLMLTWRPRHRRVQ